MANRELADIPPLIYVKAHVLKSLTLMRNCLQSLNETEFAKLSNLTQLNLAFNNLTCLPDTIGCLVHLKELDVSHNKLKEIPMTICMLDKLVSFNITKNHVTELPSSLGLLKNLANFYAAKNRLKGISREIIEGLNSLFVYINF